VLGYVVFSICNVHEESTMTRRETSGGEVLALPGFPSGFADIGGGTEMGGSLSPSPAEWAKLTATAAPHLLRFLTVAYGVGPRKGELLKLEWPDVDMRRKEFTLRKTKNGQARVVPMTPDVFDTFAELHKERRLDTPRVFLYNEKPWKTPRTAFAAACRRAGVMGLRLHDLRHCAATNLRRAGVDTTTAMKIIGHKSEQMHRRYNTIQTEDLHEAAEKLQRYRANTLITHASDLASG
jgi:integrase